MSQNVFETPEAFNEYAGQLAARLRTRWEARILFLQQGIAQLQALKRVAEAVRDEQTLSEVSAQLVGAQEELQRLQTAIGSAGDVSTSSAAGGAGNPESTPPSSQPEMVAAVPPAPAVVEAAPAPLLPAPPPTEVAQPPGVVAPAPPVDPEESRPAAPAPPVVLEPVPAAPMGTVSAPLSPPPAVWEQPAAAAVEETLPAPPWKEGPNKAGADPAVQAAVLFQKPVPEAPKGAEAKSSPAPVAEPEHLDLDFEVLPPAAPAPEARPDPSGTWVGPVPTAAAVPEPATPVAEGWMDRTRRLHLDLATGDQRLEWVQNRSIGEKLGGIGRSFAYIRDHYTRIRDAFDPENPLVVNVGCTTGTKAMTGLRIYFTAFSPLKQSREDDPGIAYSAASGDFGTYFRRTGLDDLVLTGRAAQPSLLVLEGDGETITARVEDGSWLCGLTTNQKV
ncbi:MAG: hypothetical protein FJX77_07510, partial [Armatimonadetes bacterium]|nr:hypothetical protein [Armatimonadota bacterium]